ncbi:MAG: hypothetical protein Q9213_003127 [Squamulea squamosa]
MSTSNHGSLGNNGGNPSFESVQAYWNDDHPILQQPLAGVNQSNGTDHIRQPLSQDAEAIADSTHGQQISSAQQPLHLSSDQTNKLTKEEEDELNDLKRHRDHENEVLAKQREAAERAQCRLERAEARIKQRLRKSQVLRPSNSSYTNQQPRPLPSVTTTTPRLTAISTLGKRNVVEFGENKDENGSEQNERRSRRRLNLEQTEKLPSLSNTSTSRGIETLGPRKQHAHPSNLRRRSSQLEALAHLPSSVGLDPLQGSNSAAGNANPPHRYGHLAHQIGDGEDLLGLNPLIVQNVGCQYTVPTDTAPFTDQRPYGSSPNGSLNNQLNFPKHVSPQPLGGSASLWNNLHSSEHTANAASTTMPGQQPGQPYGEPFLTVSDCQERDHTNRNATEGKYVEGGKGEQPPTKRQKKRQAMLESGKAIPKDSEKVKGVIKQDEDGNLFYLFHGEWVPAAFHHERRLALLARGDLKGAYTYPPKQGLTEDDRMAFHPDYANINMSVRHGRPHLLYQWRAPDKLTQYEQPSLMRDPNDGKLLLDINNHPILDWPELPKTVSAQVEGFWIEYWWRLNRNIRIEDIIARAPAMTKKSATSTYRTLPGLSAFGNRRERDRLATGTCSWEQKEGSSTIRAQYERIMPNRVMAEIAHNNTTTWFRDLSNQEIRSICHANKGKGTALLRAGNRTLNEDKKMKVDSKKDPVLEATYRRLLQEKQDADALDPYYGQEQPPNPGFAFSDSGAGRAQHGSATVIGNANTQNQSPHGDDAGYDTTLFEPLPNKNDTTLVEVSPKHGFGQSVAPGVVNTHQSAPVKSAPVFSQTAGWYGHWDGRMTEDTQSNDLKRTYQTGNSILNERPATTREKPAHSSRRRSLVPDHDDGQLANVLLNATGAATELQTSTMGADAPPGYVAATDVSKGHVSEPDLWTGSRKRLSEQHYGLQDQSAGNVMLPQNPNGTFDPANDNDDISNDFDSFISQFTNQGKSAKREAEDEDAEQEGGFTGNHEDALGEGLEFDAAGFDQDLLHSDGLQFTNEDTALDLSQYEEIFSNPVE